MDEGQVERYSSCEEIDEKSNKGKVEDKTKE